MQESRDEINVIITSDTLKQVPYDEILNHLNVHSKRYLQNPDLKVICQRKTSRRPSYFISRCRSKKTKFFVVTDVERRITTVRLNLDRVVIDKVVK